MNNPDPNRSPIFIVGSGRSGTTLLRLRLNAHPRIYLTHEASFYLGSEYVPKRATASDWLESYLRSLFFTWLGVSREEIRADLQQRIPGRIPRERISEVYRAIMRCPAHHFNKPRFGDKTPLHASYIHRIFQDFEDPKVIHMIRDPRAVVASLINMPWAPPGILLNSLYCARQLRIEPRYRDRVLTVRLEDLVADPKSTMGSILAFIGEPWDDAVLSSNRPGSAHGMPPYPWFESSKTAILAAKSRAKLDFSPEAIRIVEALNKSAMTQHGYRLSNPDANTLNLIGRLVREVPPTLGFLFRFLRLMIKASGRYPAPPEQIERLMLSLDPVALRQYPNLLQTLRTRSKANPESTLRSQLSCELDDID